MRKANLKDYLTLPPNQDVEIIVLFNDVPVSESPQIYRKPPVELAGKVKILGNIILPAVEKNDWEALQ